MKRIGFTGTQVGMTRQQKVILRLMIAEYDELHHGDCVGADAESHVTALELRMIRIVIHPPINKTRAAYSTQIHNNGVTQIEVRPDDEYHMRDRRIVIETGELIACPKCEEYLRSGTWTTVRYARKQRVPIHIIMPDGSLKHE